MNSVNFAIGFTLMFCASLFFGINDTSLFTQQVALVFSGFCLAGVVILILEEM
jgi:hypothetical protein